MDEATKDEATLYAPCSRELHKAARDQAYEERRPIAALVREAVEQYLERAKAPKNAKASA